MRVRLDSLILICLHFADMNNVDYHVEDVPTVVSAYTNEEKA